MRRRSITAIVTVILAVATLVVFKLCLNGAYKDVNKDRSGIVYTQMPNAPLASVPLASTPDSDTQTETEPTTTEPEGTRVSREKAQALLDSMTLEEKVYQLFVVTPELLTDVAPVTAGGEMTRQALASKPVGGIVYFSDNIRSRNQITGMIANTQSYSKIPLFIGVEEEGGTVARVSDRLGTTAVSPMATYGEQADAQAVLDIGKTIAANIAQFGFNLNLAPVADVITNPNNTALGSRSFGTDAAVTSEMVAAMVQGLQEGGVLSCLKHFPGEGGAQTDAQTGASVSTRTLAELRQAELLPFRAGIDAGAQLVMVSHMSAPSITGSNVPCDLSAEIVTNLLRGEMHYQGIVITDSHQLNAITDSYTSAEAAVLALQAGCDMILMPDGLTDAANGILSAIERGDLTEARIDESVLRILTLKYQIKLCKD